MIPLNTFPMGANSLKPKQLEAIWTDKNYVFERKMDGERYLLIHDLDGSVRLTSRTKSKKTGYPVDKIGNCEHLITVAKKTPPGTCLDGEIITHVNCTSSDVATIMGCKPDKALKRQKENGFVNFYVYDILWYDKLCLADLPWWNRREYLEDCVINKIGLENKNIMLSAYFTCDMIDVHQWYDEIVESGAEGIMGKHRDSTYKIGSDKMEKPAGRWYKIKCNDTFDCIITGFLEPEKYYTGKELTKENGVWNYWINDRSGKMIEKETKIADVPEYVKPVTRYYFNGWIGSIIFSQYTKDGELIEVGSTSGMDDEMRKYISENKTDFIGSVVEIGGMSRIEKTNAIRHPFYIRQRTDKSPSECTIS